MINETPGKAPAPPWTIRKMLATTTVIVVGIAPNNKAVRLIRIDRVSKTTPSLSLNGIDIIAIQAKEINIPFTICFNLVFLSFI